MSYILYYVTYNTKYKQADYLIYRHNRENQAYLSISSIICIYLII